MTLTTQELVNWLKTKGLTGLYAGYYPKDKARVFGVYTRTNPVSVNGYRPTYNVKGFTIIIHWTKSLYETEAKANELHELLDRAKFSNDSHNGWIECNGNPVDVGKDENGICEYSLDLTVYVKNNTNTGGNSNV